MTNNVDKYKCTACGSVWTKNQLLGNEQHKQCGDACCGANVCKLPEKQELIHTENAKELEFWGWRETAQGKCRCGQVGLVSKDSGQCSFCYTFNLR